MFYTGITYYGHLHFMICCPDISNAFKDYVFVLHYISFDCTMYTVLCIVCAYNNSLFV